MSLTFVLGSIHAFSVFLQPWESLLSASRSEVSLIYSFALMALTASVLLGHLVFGKMNAAVLSLVICLVASAGAYLAGLGSRLSAVMIGYSLLFGAANGFGYGFSLQMAGQAWPGRKGAAMGLVTAFYAFGATVFAIVFKVSVDAGGVAMAMNVLAGALVATGLLCALLMHLGRVRYRGEEKGKRGTTTTGTGPVQRLLWLGYGAGCMAGLMAIGHATGIVASAGGGAALIAAGPVSIALASMGGGVAAGWLADRVQLAALLKLLPLLSACALLLLSFSPGVAAVMGALVLVGGSYGALIAAYPVAVSDRFGPRASARIYGRVFTAWGLAGLVGPWGAGALFDLFGDYDLAMGLAGAVSLVSLACMVSLQGKPGG